MDQMATQSLQLFRMSFLLRKEIRILQGISCNVIENMKIYSIVKASKSDSNIICFDQGLLLHLFNIMKV